MDDNRRAISVDGVFDIETENWDTFVYGGIMYADGQYRDYGWKQEDDYADEILSFEGTLWAHNGGKFDAIWLLDHILKRNLGTKVKVGLAGSRIVRIKIGDLEVRDSYALIPLKLEDAAKIGGETKCKLEFPCNCGGSCGGYCTISRQMPSSMVKRLREYLRQDCGSLLSLLHTITGFANDNELDLCGTIGMSAWSTAARMSQIPDADWSDKRGSTRLYGFARDSYFGGRTQVIRPKADSGFRYDMVSAYPAALASLSLPTGERVEEFGTDARASYALGKPGVYQAIVFVPDDCFLPPLPVRLKSRIAYPTGKMSGTWSLLELQNAERVGAKIESISRAVVWGLAEKILEPFCRYIWKLRDAAGATTPLGKWLKLYANSLTGKLAQDPNIEEVEIDPEDVKDCPANWNCAGGMLHDSKERNCCPHQMSPRCKTCKISTWLDSHQRICSKKSYRIADCAYVHWAAYLTAYTRVEWLTEALSDGENGKTVCMGDTDSIISTKERDRRVSGHLGGWKFEGTFRDFLALAPKTYRYWDIEAEKWLARSKGIPDAVKNWEALVSGEKIPNNRGVASFKSALAVQKKEGGPLFRRNNLWRQVEPDGIHFGDRTLGDKNLTYPPSMIQLQGLTEVVS